MSFPMRFFPKEPPAVVVFVMGCILMLSACVMIGHTGYCILKGVVGMAWPTTEGTVLYAGIHTEVIHEEDESYLHHEVVTEYRYTVKDRELRGHVIHPAADLFTDDAANQRLENLLRKADKVRVSYNPLFPQDSMLGTGFHVATLQQFFVGGLMLFFGTGMLVGCCCWAVLKEHYVDHVKFVEE